MFICSKLYVKFSKLINCYLLIAKVSGTCYLTNVNYFLMVFGEPSSLKALYLYTCQHIFAEGLNLKPCPSLTTHHSSLITHLYL